MPDDAKGEAAIEAEAGTEWDGRKLTVNKAKPREDRPARSSSGNPYNDRDRR